MKSKIKIKSHTRKNEKRKKTSKFVKKKSYNCNHTIKKNKSKTYQSGGDKTLEKLQKIVIKIITYIGPSLYYTILLKNNNEEIYHPTNYEKKFLELQLDIIRKLVNYIKFNLRNIRFELEKSIDPIIFKKTRAEIEREKGIFDKSFFDINHKKIIKTFNITINTTNNIQNNNSFLRNNNVDRLIKKKYKDFNTFLKDITQQIYNEKENNFNDIKTIIVNLLFYYGYKVDIDSKVKSQASAVGLGLNDAEEEIREEENTVSINKYGFGNESPPQNLSPTSSSSVIPPVVKSIESNESNWGFDPNNNENSDKLDHVKRFKNLLTDSTAVTRINYNLTNNITTLRKELKKAANNIIGKETWYEIQTKEKHIPINKSYEKILTDLKQRFEREKIPLKNPTNKPTSTHTNPLMKIVGELTSLEEELHKPSTSNERLLIIMQSLNELHNHISSINSSGYQELSKEIKRMLADAENIKKARMKRV